MFQEGRAVREVYVKDRMKATKRGWKVTSVCISPWVGCLDLKPVPPLEASILELLRVTPVRDPKFELKFHFHVLIHWPAQSQLPWSAITKVTTDPPAIQQ